MPSENRRRKETEMLEQWLEEQKEVTRKYDKKIEEFNANAFVSDILMGVLIALGATYAFLSLYIAITTNEVESFYRKHHIEEQKSHTSTHPVEPTWPFRGE